MARVTFKQVKHFTAKTRWKRNSRGVPKIMLITPGLRHGSNFKQSGSLSRMIKP